MPEAKPPPPDVGAKPPEAPNAPEATPTPPTDGPQLTPSAATLRWGVPLAIVVVTLAGLGLSRSRPPPPLDYTAFFAAVEAGDVERVVLRGNAADVVLSTPRLVDDRDVTLFRTQLPTREDPALLPLLRTEVPNVEVVAEEGGLSWAGLLASLFPWLLLLGAWYWLNRRAREASDGPRNAISAMLGSGGTRFEREDAVDTRFDDVAGLHSAKRDLAEIVSFLRAPEKFERLGGNMPRGALLVGAPGTGKTLLARAVAGEAGVHFFSISGSEFIELFVGVGASRVRNLFAAARKAAPAIIFIDEIDAVGRARGAGLGGGNDEREQTLNQLLAAMDGFDRSDRVVVMAATNRPDVLDPALLRPGRFDRRILVDLPAREAREAILTVHARGKRLAPDVSLGSVAAATPGFSGADLANLLNEAILGAIRRGGDETSMDDFAAAQDKILLGDPREAHLTPHEKRRVAVHEAGHALTAHVLDPSSPLRRISILPRGSSLGATQQSPRPDTFLHTKSELLSRLAVLLGGFAAERLVLGQGSTGAEDDLRRASDIAHRMVGQLGMSDTLGPVFYEHRSEHPFLGARVATDGGVSDATVHAIERESQALLADAEATATATLTTHRFALERLVAGLLASETLDGDSLAALLATATEASVASPTALPPA